MMRVTVGEILWFYWWFSDNSFLPLSFCSKICSAFVEGSSEQRNKSQMENVSVNPLFYSLYFILIKRNSMDNFISRSALEDDLLEKWENFRNKVKPYLRNRFEWDVVFCMNWKCRWLVDTYHINLPSVELDSLRIFKRRKA